MGNRQYDSIDLTKSKRDWIAFYIGLQQATEVIILLNVVYLIIFNYLIIIPLFFCFLILFKKWWVLVLSDRLVDCASEDNRTEYTLFGITPKVITDHYLRQRNLEFIIHYLVSVGSLSYPIIYDDDRVFFLLPFFIGIFTCQSLLNQEFYLQFKNNWLLLLQQVEIAIGCILNISFMFLFFKIGWYCFIIFIVLLSAQFGYYYNKYWSIEECFMTQIIGYIYTQPRTVKFNRNYNQKDITKSSVFKFSAIMQIAILAVVDLLFNDKEQMKNLRQFLYFYMILYIPTAYKIVQNWIRFVKYGTHIKNIVISEQEKNQLENWTSMQKFLTFSDHEQLICYETYEIEFEKLKPLFDKAFNDNERMYKFKVVYEHEENLIEMSVQKEKLCVQIYFKNLAFVDVVCESLVNSYFHLQKADLRIDNKTLQKIRKTQLEFFQRYFPLSYCEFLYLDVDTQYHVFQNKHIYEQLMVNMLAFQKCVSLSLYNNPNSVYYDLYEAY